MADKRTQLVAWAEGQVGSNDRVGYWNQALGHDPGKGKAWCGAFCLAGMHAVGLASHHKWGIDGSGMLGPLGLEPHHRTTHPRPGDIGYQDHPYQHHFIVTEVGVHTFSSVDGNQGIPGVQSHSRVLDPHKYLFYNIDSLLEAHDTDPLPPPHRPELDLGSLQRAEVLEVQMKLNKYQSAGLKTDGLYGPKTARAVQIFQRDRGLDADGIVGDRTWQELDRV